MLIKREIWNEEISIDCSCRGRWPWYGWGTGEWHTAAEKVTLQLKWVTQGQFAGYYVAKDKGFYKEADLDVEIKPGGPDIAPPQVIAGGGADVVIDWMPSALAQP